MVATSGPYSGGTWHLAKSLIALVRQADERWPNRDRRSDGSIGDLAHMGRKSDHNPDGNGDVLAVDIDEDLAAGTDLRALWRHLIDSRDPRVKYVIYEGTITASYAVGSHRAWATRPYTGPNAHRHHLHVSIHDTSAAKNDTSPWFPGAEEDDDMQLDEFTKALQNKDHPLRKALGVVVREVVDSEFDKRDMKDAQGVVRVVRRGLAQELGGEDTGGREALAEIVRDAVHG